MPNQDQLPDRSHPDTMGRPLSIQERREDVARLRSIAMSLRTQESRLDGLLNTTQRDTLKAFLWDAISEIDATADDNVKEIKRTIFAETGDRDDVLKRDGYTYQKRFR